MQNKIELRSKESYQEPAWEVEILNNKQSAVITENIAIREKFSLGADLNNKQLKLVDKK